jgi:hypothetical protein
MRVEEVLAMAVRVVDLSVRVMAPFRDNFRLCHQFAQQIDIARSKFMPAGAYLRSGGRHPFHLAPTHAQAPIFV